MIDGFQFVNLTAIGTTKLIDENRKGYLKGFSVNSAYTGSLALYDSQSGTPVGTTATDKLIGVFGTPNVSPNFISLNIRVRNGLVAVATGTPNVTIVFQ